MLDAVTLDQLRVFVAIVDTGSFSGASRRLARVQSAMSHSIRCLETNLGISLFERGGRLPQLTEAGQALLEDARRMLRNASALHEKATRFSGGMEPELAIAVDPLFPPGPLTEGIRHVQTRFPELSIRLLTGVIGEPEKCLRAGKVNLAIYSHNPYQSQDLEIRFLSRTRMIPVVAATHPLASLAGPVRREDLAGHTQLVVSSADSAGWSANIFSRNLWHFADSNARREFLLAGLGWCYMPDFLVAEALQAGSLRQLDVQEQPETFFPLYAVHLQGVPLGPGARALLEALGRCA